MDVYLDERSAVLMVFVLAAKLVALRALCSVDVMAEKWVAVMVDKMALLMVGQLVDKLELMWDCKKAALKDF